MTFLLDEFMEQPKANKISELPLLNSERYALNEKVKEANNRADAAYASALRFVTSIINQSDYLDTNQKILLLQGVWSKDE
jgi:hypothetical protein